MNDNNKTRFRDELAILSPIAVTIAVAVFVGIQVLCVMLPKGGEKGLPPFPGWVFLSIGGGLVVAAWLLLIGYINADAGRRGMGRLLWTCIALLVPNALGILAYFLLRKPKLQPCPGCHTMVSPEFRFCPHCGFALMPACTSCGRAIRHEFTWCPYCGKPVGTAGEEMPAAAPPGGMVPRP